MLFLFDLDHPAPGRLITAGFKQKLPIRILVRVFFHTPFFPLHYLVLSFLKIVHLFASILSLSYSSPPSDPGRPGPRIPVDILHLPGALTISLLTIKPISQFPINFQTFDQPGPSLNTQY